MRTEIILRLGLTAGMVLHMSAPAALDVRVTDAAGAPLADAVVFVSSATPGNVTTNTTAVIDQVNKRFLPEISAVQIGTAVNFPNKDNIRHHVYSFSPAKSFELKLYSGVPAAPVTFDHAGLVTMGCNIHDGMIAYLYVVDSPNFALTDANGQAVLPDLEPSAVVSAWHYRMTSSAAPSAAATSAAALTLVVELDPLAPVPPALDD